MKKEEKCKCNENCECGCNEGQECTCQDCNCNEECECKDDCNCGEKCECNKEKHGHKKESEIDKLKKQIKELEEKSLRDKAEMINYRKRKDDDVARLLKYKDEELILELLPVIDNFESAIKMDDNNLDDEVSKFLTGFKMMYGNILGILEKVGVKPIDGNNKPFDPAYHQAVLTEKTDMEPGMVIEVLRKGYLLKDKVLRPAMVKVSE